MCYNIQSGQEEPLAFQRLMLKHVKNISGVPVTYVAENELNQVSQGGEQQMEKYIGHMLLQGGK